MQVVYEHQSTRGGRILHRPTPKLDWPSINSSLRFVSAHTLCNVHPWRCLPFTVSYTRAITKVMLTSGWEHVQTIVDQSQDQPLPSQNNSSHLCKIQERTCPSHNRYIPSSPTGDENLTFGAALWSDHAYHFQEKMVESHFYSSKWTIYWTLQVCLMASQGWFRHLMIE